MRVLGLTGNIACGKSAVAAVLSELGARVIDADRIVHELYRRGTPTFERVVARFGAAVAGPHGIDRSRLAELVFTNPEAMSGLEALVHPAVTEEVVRMLSASGKERGAVIEAIKLVESDSVRLVEELWIVTSSQESQLGRLVATRRMSEAQALRRIEAQSPAAEKERMFRHKRPDALVIFIDNDGPFQDTRRRVEEEWRRLVGAPG